MGEKYFHQLSKYFPKVSIWHLLDYFQNWRNSKQIATRNGWTCFADQTPFSLTCRVSIMVRALSHNPQVGGSKPTRGGEVFFYFWKWSVWTTNWQYISIRKNWIQHECENIFPVPLFLFQHWRIFTMFDCMLHWWKRSTAISK